MPNVQPELDILVSLLLAALFGGLIGLEREFHHRPAGLRTNMLVCIGACMFSIIAVTGFATLDQTSRIIANVLVELIQSKTVRQTGQIDAGAGAAVLD